MPLVIIFVVVKILTSEAACLGPPPAGAVAAKRQHDALKALAKPNPRVLESIEELCQAS